MVISGDGSSRSKTTMWGWLLVGIGSLVLLGFLFTAFISHLLPPSNYTLIAAIQNDRVVNFHIKTNGVKLPCCENIQALVNKHSGGSCKHIIKSARVLFYHPCLPKCDEFSKGIVSCCSSNMCLIISIIGFIWLFESPMTPSIVASLDW